MLGSGVAWAAFDVLRKRLVERVAPAPLGLALVAGQLPLFWAWAALAPSGGVSAGYWLPGLLAAATNLAGLLLFLDAVRLSPLSLVIPLLSLTPAFSTLVAAIALAERPSPRQALGIAASVAGALVLHAASGHRTPLDTLRALVREPGSRPMLLAALVWSLGATLDKTSLGFASAGLHAALQASLACLLLGPILAVRRELGAIRALGRSRAPFLAALVAAALALGLQFLALQVALVGIVETVKRGLGMLLALVSGRLVFGEPLTPGKLGGVLLLSAGVALTLL